MTDQNKINHVKALVSSEPSGWREKAEFRRANRNWLVRSAEIAIRILGELHRKGISQAELARLMDVSTQQISKLVKGQENLTLDTISKIELALDISLINVAKPLKSKEHGFYTLVENAKLTETIEMESAVIKENDNVRPLYKYTTTQYYE